LNYRIRNASVVLFTISLASSFFIVGCGGSGDAASGGAPSLKSALYSILSTAPVISNTLQHQTSVGIPGANVSYVADKTGVAGFGAAKITVASAVSDVNGNASVAVPADTYTAQLSTLPADLVTGENAAYFAAETVTASGVKSYKADQYTVPITSPSPLLSVEVSVYQTDSAGNVDWGSYTKTVDPVTGAVTSSRRNPIVYLKTTPIAGGALTDTEVIELFKGNYRMVIRATAAAAVPPAVTPVLAPYISPVITVAGTGATVSNPVTLAAPSKAPTITLKDTLGAPITTGYTVEFYESTNQILVGTAITDPVTGTASVGAPSGATGIVAKIFAPAGPYSGVHVFSDINVTSSATLQQYTVSGQLQPSSGTLNATAIPTVYALADSGLGRWADSQVASVAATAGTGVYSLTLFGSSPALNYNLLASNVTGFPDVTKLSVAVGNAPLSAQNITVAPGGLIMGRIQTEGSSPLANVTVSVYGTAADGIIDLVNSQVTDVNGNYSLQVPYGTYFLLVNGAVSDGISVSAAAPTVSKNLTQFVMNGQVSKSIGSTTQGASGATVHAGNQQATTSPLGVYTISVMEGKNWICAMPSAANDPTYGYACNLNVLVDAASVAASRQ